MKRERSHALAWVVAGLLAVGTLAGGMGAWSWWTGEGNLPFERGAAFFKAWVAAPAGRFFRGVDGLVEMGRLETEAEGLRVRIAELERVEQENERLREALGFAGEERGRLVAARVVSRGGGSGWWREVKLGKGGNAGISAGDAVVTGDGLAGRVRSVTARSCMVMLVSDGNSRIGCELEEDARLRGPDAAHWHGGGNGGGERGRSPSMSSPGPRRGVVIGGEGRWDEGMRFVYGPNDLDMRYLGGDAAPAPGTRVVTSGMGGGLPQGIVVGEVVEGRLPEGGVAFEARVRPAVNLRDLDVVFVRVENKAADIP